MKPQKITKNSLKLINFQASIGQKTIVKDINFEIASGQLHVLIGPNGSGKSSLILAIAGYPKYKTQGKILLNNSNLATKPADLRVKLGLMVTFQNPAGVKGVTIKNLLKTAYREIYPQEKIDLSNFYQNLTNESHKLKINPSLLKRELNVDFSGGEKKLMELLSVITLKPNFVLFDEIDTGLDIDALKLMADQIAKLQKMGIGILLVTHQLKLVKLLSFQKLYLIKAGRIVAKGKTELLDKITQTGFENLKV